MLRGFAVMFSATKVCCQMVLLQEVKMAASDMMLIFRGDGGGF